MSPFWKESRTKRLLAKHQARQEGKRTVEANKRTSKARDGYRCRFPLCGCGRFKLRLESSHDRHVGMGGGKLERSQPAGMITLCFHRHQDGAISRHHGTLRIRHLTDQQNDGPVAFDVALDYIPIRFQSAYPDPTADGWVEVARERRVQVLEPLKRWQREFLEWLATLEA